VAAANNRYAPAAAPGRIADAIRFLGKKIAQQDPSLLHRVYELLPQDAWTAELAVSLAKSASAEAGTDLAAVKRLEDVITARVAGGADPELERAFKVATAANSRLRGELKQARKKLRGKRDSIGEVMSFLKGVGFNPATIIDVGVAQGTAGLYEHFPEAQILLIDPVPGSEPFMKALCEKYPRASYHTVAAGAFRGRTMFSIDPAVSGSRLVDAVGSHGFGQDVEVEVAPINELVRETGAKGPYVIKADTEGAELFVLEGATEILAETELLILETRVAPIGKAPELFETLAFLDRWGFATFDIIDRNYNDAAGFLKQFDLVAVKKDGPFRRRESYPQLMAASNKLFYDEIQRKKALKTRNMAGKPVG
jgi:FkbM family methyltransferase